MFISSNDAEATQDVLIEGNHIHGNGNVGSIYHHNVYTAAIGITFQYNRFGPLQEGAGGNNLKDRSAGLVVRYNWIEGGNRQLDLVDAEDSVLIQTDPAYPATYVYGNILLEPDGAGNKQIVHYGGDSGATSWYRRGTLYFYHNTVVSARSNGTTLFRLSTNDEHCDARNNLFYVTDSGSALALVDATGVVDLSHNWFKPGWRDTFGTLMGTINDDETSIYGDSPGFVDASVQNYHLDASSDTLDAATALHADIPLEHEVSGQYVRHQIPGVRPLFGTAMDVGAFERLPGDFVGEGSVDLDDYAVFDVCLRGPSASPDPSSPYTVPECLAAFDWDLDTDVDLSDFSHFEQALTGGRP